MYKQITPRGILNKIYENKPEQYLTQAPRDFDSYRPKLYRALSVPSYIHGYSLAVEYMKDWFVSKFPKNFFKTIHINSKHVFDDQRNFNDLNIKREKPMLSITPTVDHEFDRDNVDLYTGDETLFLKRTDYNDSFLKDYKRNIYLYMAQKGLRINFTFKIRLNTKSEQEDLYNKMNIWFGIGATKSNYISTEFHIPYEMIVSIAKSVGFVTVDAQGYEINTKGISTEDEYKKAPERLEYIREEDIMDLLNYLNSHSDLPFIYTIRSINQHPEFFIRIKKLYVHINNTDKLSVDEGERVGKLEDNFNIEMQSILTIPIPAYYVFMNQDPNIENVLVHNNRDVVGLYSINAFEVPRTDQHGWNIEAESEYFVEVGDKYIDLSDIFFNSKTNPLSISLQHSIRNGISPDAFVNIMVFHGLDREWILPSHVEYHKDNKFLLYFDRDITEPETLIIAIYADRKYLNDTILTIDKEQGLTKRINNEGTVGEYHE